MSLDSREAAEQLLGELQQAEAKGEQLEREEFNRLVKAVVEQEIATPEELSRRFRASLPTIDRWQRLTAPAPVGRQSVMTGLIAELRSKGIGQSHNLTRETSPSDCHGFGGGSVA